MIKKSQKRRLDLESNMGHWWEGVNELEEGCGSYMDESLLEQMISGEVLFCMYSMMTLFEGENMHYGDYKKVALRTTNLTHKW